MKKNGIRMILTLVIAAMLMLVLAACGGGGNGGGNPSVPSKSEFEDVGIANGFDADVKGTLSASVSDEDGIFMRWSGSNEDSFNNVIDWLNSNGYDSLDGESPEVYTMPDGSYKIYSVDKIVDGETVEAAVIYFLKDTNLFGQSYKAGELYLAIEPVDDGSLPDNGNNTVWPTSQIAAVIGANKLPAYTGTASNFTFSSNTILATTVTVTISGASESDADTYKSLLLSSGYTESLAGYTKSFADGDVTVIVVGSGSVITVTATFSSGSGEQDTWPAAQLASAFSGSGVTVPEFEGASNFDFANLFGVVTVKAYGAASHIAAYEAKLLAAGFTEASSGTYSKDASNNQVLEISISDMSVIYSGQVWLVITLEDKPAAPTVHYTLPQNVKVNIVASGMTTTVIKVGNDYYSSLAASGTTMSERYLKHDNGTWTEYTKLYSGAWTASGETFNATSLVDELESTYYFGYMTEDYTDYTLTFERQETIAGVTTDVKSHNLMGEMVYYIHSDTGLVFKMTSAFISFEVTLWQTSGVSFDGITLPE